ncbi:MAG: ribonuclease HII [Erysipelotrichaceae bacterium]|nr:ribonuclease HII [Erysipelotrichaceae bacterium]
MKTANEYEKLAWEKGLTVVGIDEAGRGPLAGPLVVAGVVFPVGYDSGEINDSKQLTEKKRERLYDIIIRDALFYQIEIVEPEEIDRINILEADRAAMTRIALAAPTDIVLTDAVDLYIKKNVTSLIKGDTLSCSIAAGSILAKVTRDRLMYEYDKLYPEYGFAKHKGYGTKAHMEALRKYGACPIHRRSFRPVLDTLQGTLF